MGNSRLAQGCQAPSGHAATDIESSNGILAKIPGDVIARGLGTLPSASSSGADTHVITITLPDFGKVEVYVERKRVRHGRHSHSYWQACRAEAVSE